MRYIRHILFYGEDKVFLAMTELLRLEARLKIKTEVKGKQLTSD
jgi:hypothetical protein